MDDRIEHIKKLQKKGFKIEPSQVTVMGNFYAIVTIVIVCLCMLYFVNYILPTLKEKQQKQVKIELKQQENQKLIEERARRIALSHKLNAGDTNAPK